MTTLTHLCTKKNIVKAEERILKNRNKKYKKSKEKSK